MDRVLLHCRLAWTKIYYLFHHHRHHEESLTFSSVSWILQKLHGSHTSRLVVISYMIRMTGLLCAVVHLTHALGQSTKMPLAKLVTKRSSFVLVISDSFGYVYPCSMRVFSGRHSRFCKWFAKAVHELCWNASSAHATSSCCETLAYQ